MPSTPVASMDESDDSDGADDDNATASDDEVDGDASSPSDDQPGSIEARNPGHQLRRRSCSHLPLPSC